MWGVLRFYNFVRSGITWKGPEVMELEYNDHVPENQLATKQHKSYDFSSYHTQTKTALPPTLSSSKLRRDCDHQKYHYYTHRRRHSSSSPQTLSPSIGCCAFFDLDDYDNENGDYDYEEGDAYDCDGYYDDDAGDYYEDEDSESSDCSMLGASPNHKRNHQVRNNNIRSVLISKRHNKYKISQPQTRLEVINESERSAGSGSDENDSLLVAYDSSSSLAPV